jgi:cytochrome c556
MTLFRHSKLVTAAVIATFATALTTGGALLAAGAAPTPQAAIATRQAGYKKMGGAMKALGDQLKSGAPAKDAMIAAARAIALTAREQPKLFPVGSGPAAGVKTDALPNIWTERAAFDASSDKLIAESTKLFAVANGGDAAAIQAQMKVTGAVCGGCHRQFRADT